MRSLIAAGPTTGPGCGYPGTVDRMGKALIIVLGIALLVYAFFDLIATPGDRVRFMPKPLWFIVLLLAPVGPKLASAHCGCAEQLHKSWRVRRPSGTVGSRSRSLRRRTQAE